MGTKYETPIANDYLEQRAELGTALFSLTTLASESSASPEAVKTLQNLQGSLREPFLFVVAGEVKAGKSSLLNALFGREFCRVDVLPATDRVYVFKYGEQAHDVPINPGLTERYQPIGFLRDFNIVDTPGTNTIVADHQAITEQFVPQADLILFVFSVVNPWVASAWTFLDLLQKRWLKNVVFVLQQADLRDPAEVEVVTQHLRQTAMQRLGQAFPIFAVSAKKALMSKTSGVDKDRLWTESNFGTLETFINEHVSSTDARGAKLKSVCQTAQVVLRELSDQARSSERIIGADREQLAHLRETVAQMQKRSGLQVEGFLRGVETAYDRCQQQGEHLLRQQLTLLQSFKLAFGRGQTWQRDFQRNIETMLRAAISKQMEHALGLLENELKSVWSQLHDSLQNNFNPEARKNLGKPLSDLSEQRAQLVQKIDMVMVERMADDSIEKQLQGLFAETANWVRVPAGATAIGMVAAAVAAHLAAVAVFDITGTLAALSAVAGLVMAPIKRRQVLNAYQAQMTAKKLELSHSIGDLVRQTLDVFYQKLAQVYQPLEVFCDVQESRYRPMLERVASLEANFNKIVARL